MHAMQYEITLPADYDMTTIRHRVATRGALLDDFPGLGLKAYGIRERGVDGSPVNQYTPFYLWAAPDAMNRFLWGPGFRGIRDDFGRPAVQHWTGLGFARGPASASAPRAAVRRTWRLPADADPAEAVDGALGELTRLGGTAGVHCTALAVDPRHWELVSFTVWEHAGPDTPERPGVAEARYEVLHLCRPELDALPEGRQW
ncbi:DUF4865 family protein [Peterkaempfera bronchialis]|uniref:DUF4865 family protein n=1 Tax=Peterkaempfera bronchialis TaxID=2126346 RepID=A0A345SRU3_9ACTN|nr:DUF4865 family protein [Peterkaempfera bronchialis]AXI76448.1 DUF4865 family protein [Peterkaempfera bronchialis]